MRRVCLTLPTNRPCIPALVGTAAEAAYGAAEFGVEVHLLVLDSADEQARAAHREVLASLPPAPHVVVHHFDEDDQRAFLADAVARSGAGTQRLTALLLPAGVSYGACTNRAFLFAEALGCASVHRRDSDSAYQKHEGEPLFPIRHELSFLGERAGDAVGRATSSRLDPSVADHPLMLVGGSFIGPMSVDLDGIRLRDSATYEKVVSLSVPDNHPPLWRNQWVASAFRGAGTEGFVTDRTTLTRVNPAQVDMCNVALAREVYGHLPLPPALDTLGSDYFLLHAVYGARLPGVLHNRHIVNHHTPARRSGPGFLAYQVRLAKFFLAVPRLHSIYAGMAAAGAGLLDGEGRLRTKAVADLVRADNDADHTGDARRLDVLEQAYRGLGDPWDEAADLLAGRRAELLSESQADMEDFVRLLDAWPALTRACRETGRVNAR